ncbi:MAG: ABC transporter ATP-binding protein [Holophaga sp.]
MTFIIEMQGITKSFPGVRANDEITLRVEKGSIHALLGENGAGKSTLMSILSGLYQPDAGSIRVRGKTVAITAPSVAHGLGIGMVHQHFQLVHSFTVAENIILGREPRSGLVIDRDAAARRVRALSETYGLQVDPQARVEDISVGMQQRVEILKMLYRDAEILIFDEPTAVLTPQEIQELMGIMRKLAREGKTVLLITHKLREIKEVADTCTVLRRGRLIGTVAVAETSETRMAEMMVGREVDFRVEKAQARPGPALLRIESLGVRNAKGLPGVKDLSLEVRAGEILGLCGIDGNGQSELIGAVTGLVPAESGRILFKGVDITALDRKRRTRLGLGHIPEDRQRHGLVLDFRLDENLVIHSYDRRPFSRIGVLDARAIRENAERLIAEFDVRCAQGPATVARALSGGNQQKAVLARELDHAPEVLVIAQPTRGLDVGAVEFIHRRIIAERDKGNAILLVSLDLDEIMDLSDRIAVIHGGEIAGTVDAAQASANELGRLMAGAVGRAS